MAGEQIRPLRRDQVQEDIERLQKRSGKLSRADKGSAKRRAERSLNPDDPRNYPGYKGDR